jgi:hypothetical protein
MPLPREMFDAKTKSGLTALLAVYQGHPRLASFFSSQAHKKEQGAVRDQLCFVASSISLRRCLHACVLHVAEELHAAVTALQALKNRHAALQAEHSMLAGVVSQDDLHPEKQKQLQSQFKEIESSLLIARGDNGQQIDRLFMACMDCQKLLEYFEEGKSKGLCLTCSVASLLPGNLPDGQ